ncbi:MAG: sn-glycerol-3-phosphate ABC transporter ATP-binding protein UgpC [Candidatus Neomarinimicrobiota bacterium]
MATVQLQAVNKSYTRDKLVVRNFSLDIADGEFIVLVGPSGCGKSTILRMIAGLEEVTSGTIRIDGNVVNDQPPKDRDIAMVFQNYALYPHMNVFKNLAFGLKLRKYPQQEITERVQRAADILEIGRYLDKKPKELSGGERQRVALGRAIVRDPKVFLFDEPLSNLDAKLRVQMRAEIKKLHRDLKTTMIYVTHDQVEAMTMGDRIVILKDGETQQVGSPLNVYQAPANMFVGSFIGSPAMNFINGTVVGGRFIAGDLRIDLPETMPKFADSQSLALGIRPEDILIDQGDITAEVLVTEPLGSETIIHLLLEQNPLVVKCQALVFYPPGERLAIKFKPDRIRLFDRESGRPAD